MPLSKSQIYAKLKSGGFKAYPLDNSTSYIPTDDRKGTLRTILAMFVDDGAKPSVTYPASATGAVRLGAYTLVVTRDKYAPGIPKIPSGKNESVQNRLAFGTMIQDVIANTLRPLTIEFVGGKRIIVKHVTATKFLGEGVADFVLRQGARTLPVSVHQPGGSYRHAITNSRVLDQAHDALVKVTEDGDIDASMDGDRMYLGTPVAFEADSPAIRELMFQDLRGGVGVVGEFKPADYSYDGKSNTLTISCDRVYQSQTDLRSDDKPYFIIYSSESGKIGDLEGLQVEMVPKRALPNRVTLAKV